MSTFRYQHLKGKIEELKKKLYEGEIGVNTTKGEEAIYLKNDSGDVVEFVDKEYVDEKAPKIKCENNALVIETKE